MKKLLLCIGAAKSGTTWLYRNLEKNPGVWFTPEKEPNYFFSRHGWFDRLTPQHRQNKLAQFIDEARGWISEEAAAAWFDRYLHGEATPDWYRSLFEEAPEDRWACDFSPSTSLIPGQGWDEVAAFAPEVRIIYMMREPTDRLWSHVKFHAQFTGEAEAFRDMSLAEMEELIERASLSVDGDYGSNLERVLQKIPLRRVHLIDYGRIAREPDVVLAEVERFLDIPPTPQDDAVKEERFNPSERLPRPAGFGEAFEEHFYAEAQKLVTLGAGFARPWRSRYGGPADKVREIAARLFRR